MNIPDWYITLQLSLDLTVLQRPKPFVEVDLIALRKKSPSGVSFFMSFGLKSLKLGYPEAI